MFFFSKYSAETSLPVSISSLAKFLPRVLEIKVPPRQGNRPSFISGKPNLASFVAKIISHARLNSKPPPTANLFTQAIMGF